jgi:uncharacterized protein (TIGR02246 family)
VIFMLACIAAAGVDGFLAVRCQGPALGDERVGAMPSPGDPKTAKDEKTIQKNLQAYVKAYNAGDAKATAAFWAVDGEFIDADGNSFKGRDAIAKEFASYFAEGKGLSLSVSLDSLRFVGPGVAIESGTNYSYWVRATWTEDGSPVEKARTVSFHAGTQVRVDFTSPLPGRAAQERQACLTTDDCEEST